MEVASLRNTGCPQFFYLPDIVRLILETEVLVLEEREQVKCCTLLKAEGAIVSVRRKQRGLSALKQSDDCYCTII